MIYTQWTFLPAGKLLFCSFENCTIFLLRVHLQTLKLGFHQAVAWCKLFRFAYYNGMMETLKIQKKKFVPLMEAVAISITQKGKLEQTLRLKQY